MDCIKKFHNVELASVTYEQPDHGTKLNVNIVTIFLDFSAIASLMYSELPHSPPELQPKLQPN